MKSPYSLFEQVSTITGLSMDKLYEEWNKCSHEGKRQIYHQLKTVLKSYKDVENGMNPEKLARLAAANDYNNLIFTSGQNTREDFLKEYPTEDIYVNEWWKERYLPIIKTGKNENG